MYGNAGTHYGAVMIAETSAGVVSLPVTIAMPSVISIDVSVANKVTFSNSTSSNAFVDIDLFKGSASVDS